METNTKYPIVLVHGNVNEIKAQGYVFEEKDVTWYRISDNGDPQVVGNGYSYGIQLAIREAGFTPRQRNQLYELL